MIRKVSQIIFLACIIIACAPTKRPINFGSDECTYCKMIISDSRFGAEVVTVKGKVYTFDSVECLAAYQIKQTSAESAHSIWVINFNQPGKLINTASAAFLFSERIRSPMGLNLAAFAEGEDLLPDDAGKVIMWSEVLELVKEKWFGKAALHKPAGSDYHRESV